VAKKLTLVLRVSDDTSEMFQEWIDNATDKVMFMGTVTDILDMRVEPYAEDQEGHALPSTGNKVHSHNVHEPSRRIHG
jgi:hypothetical protein